MISASSATRLRLLVFVPVAILLALLCSNFAILWSPTGYSVLYEEWLPSVPGPSEQRIGKHVWQKVKAPLSWLVRQDEHPIRELMRQADDRFQQYESDRSRTFKQAVETYRRRYGRHPPPGYKEWYKYARKRDVHNIDDFQQVNDDLRPFWAVPPEAIRVFAAHSSDDLQHGLSIISIRDGYIFMPLEGWRAETFVKMLSKVVKWLPDMDIPLNTMDQPRVVVPWEDLQQMLSVEETTRSLQSDGVHDDFTKGMSNFSTSSPDGPGDSWLGSWDAGWFSGGTQGPVDEKEPAPDYGWFGHAGQQYMDLVSKACPPESYARNPTSSVLHDKTEHRYKHHLGGLITNFNLSSDLCTVGHQISELHGMLYASTSMLATHKLVPVFGECKINVNNDILFPANMYYKRDPRYEYDDEDDIGWDTKEDMMVWRGVTSGGTTHADEGERWRQMHRQRLVLLANTTELADTTRPILALSDASSPNGAYAPQPFRPAGFAANYTDIGFTQTTACIPDCGFYDAALAMLGQIGFSETFRSKYLIDVDGMSFSGRWRAFLQSRSLGLKATIFREWHDSRLWAWRHFVPMDNRYDDLYSLLTYFIGAQQEAPLPPVKVPRHDYEAYKLARQGRDWAAKVLRREDIEIYLFRLLLEYGRVIDDNRDRIGFVGDGGSEMEALDEKYPAVD